ncbi:class II aldolase/adducin family protein [Paenibacillus sp. JSM ZJ436]|uniref:class II aldolase/adducin family protein n=1 Tax=Paenibacillus sp. JSM ZJ436 TaxID=3376190 RepID=UPI0037BA770C
MNKQLRNELVQTGRYLLDHQLTWGNSGNLSARSSSEDMLITASGTELGHLDEDHFVKVSLHDGEWSSSSKPSKELPMHRAVYLARDDAHAVIHASPFWSTLAACSSLEIPSNLFVESMYYVEKIAYVDYVHPGSLELGEAVEHAAAEAEVIMLRNHGVIVFDRSVKEAVMRLQTLEMTCRLLVTALQAKLSLHELDASMVEDFLNNANYKPRMNRKVGKRNGQ